MPKLDNVRRIISEDFEEKDRELIQILSGNINFFMDQVVEVVNGKLDFDNLNRDLVTIEATIDSDGNPIGNNKFAASVGAKGGKVINATNQTNPSLYVESAPYIVFEATQERGIYIIRKIRGLQANNKYRILLEVIY